MKAVSIILAVALAVGVSSAAVASTSGTATHDGLSTARSAPVLLAKNGADNQPGDDRGGQRGHGGNGRAGHDDGAHHH
jgi:hypothetical protein